jgi:tRNA pseudouridine38-40 synthase
MKKFFPGLNFADDRNLMHAAASMMLAVDIYAVRNKNVAPTFKQAVSSIRAAWLFADLAQQMPQSPYKKISDFFYAKAYGLYGQVLELLQNGREPAEAAGNMGPDMDKNWGYDGILYMYAKLTLKVGSKEPDITKRVANVELTKRYLSRIFGMGKSSKDKPSVIIDMTRDLYDKMNEMLQKWNEEIAARRRRRTRRIALLVQYDGTAFNGWQIQDDGGRTVQACLECALEILLREKVRTIVAGRTDTGVHALGQVVHFDTASAIPLQRLCIGLNGICDPDLSILNAFAVPDDFHARFSAVSREYQYRLYCYPLRCPFNFQRALWVRGKVDAAYLRQCFAYLEGEHYFSSFCKKISVKSNMVRRIESIQVTDNDPEMLIDIRGNAFLHNMIRIIMGTVLAMWEKKLAPETLAAVIDGRDRDCAGKTAPAYALYLKKINYQPELDTYPAAY